MPFGTIEQAIEDLRAGRFIVVADDEDLTTGQQLGFGTVRRNNNYVSRKFNDGIQAALDPDWNIGTARRIWDRTDDFGHWRCTPTL